MLLINKAKLFFQDESGLTVVEYVVGASVMLIGSEKEAKAAMKVAASNPAALWTAETRMPA